MHKTNYDSYCLKRNGLPKGCKFCVRGQKLVLFISGKCSRNCIYCSLSKKRKNKDDIWANERKCQNTKDVINEVIESNSKGAGITGGDPLIVLNRTITYAKALKRKFGKSFHIHIYLPTKLITKEKLKKLSKCIDEVRIHPEFLKNNKNTSLKDEIAKIKFATLFWKKQNIGIELPVLPNKTKEIFNLINKTSHLVGFVNLNELEISETNFNYITNNYKLNKDSYTINGSKEAGLKILKLCRKNKLNIKVHLCTANTKNQHQYKNRLKLHKILPYGYKTREGTVRYFAIYSKDNKKINKNNNNNNNNKINFKNLTSQLKKFKYVYPDIKRNRILLSEKIVPKILALDKYKIARTEEFPTYDGDLIQLEIL